MDMGIVRMSKLTHKQELFCKEYLIDLNATQAAIRAGYSKKTARIIAAQNLSKVNISEKIQILMSERSKRVEIDSDWVLKQLKTVADRCMTEEPVMVRGANGMEESGEYKFDSSGANRALELIGKNKKMFTDKFEVDATIQITEIVRKII